MAKRDVQISISAKDNTGTGLRSAKSALQRFADAQRATQNRRDALAGSQKAAEDAARAYREAADQAAELGRKLANARRPSAEMRAEFDAARTSARLAKADMNGTAQALAVLNGRAASARGSFAAFDQAARGVAQSQRDVAGAAAQTNVALAAQGRAGARGRGAGAGSLGLRPHELQNLGYQVNDLITQIASGTSPMQAFAQQGGQIAQIFPAATGAVLRMAPVIAIVTAALSPFIAKLAEVNANAKSLKDFEVALAASGDGASYSAPKLAELAAHLDGIGFSAGEARDAIREFVGDAVAPDYLERFAMASRDLAKVLKVDLKEAAKQVSDAFTGNASDILALDDTLNFLTQSERRHIEVLKAQGREAQARTVAFAIFERRYDDAAGKMRGPWSQILANFGSSWRAFVDYVNFIDFSKVKAEINGLLALIARLTSRLPGARNGTLGALQTRRAEIDAGLAATGRALEGNNRGTTSFGGPSRRDLERQRDRLLRQRTDVGIDIANLENQARPRAAPADTTIDPPPVPTARNGGRERGASDIERRAEAQRDFVAGLEAENAARRFQTGLISETEREARILAEIEQTRIAAARVGLTLTADQAAAIRQTISAQYDANVEQEAFLQVSRDALDLANRRGEVETRAAFVARRLTEENLTRESALYAIRADQLGQLYDIEDATRRREAVERAVSDQQTRRAELQTQIQFAEETGNTGVANALTEQLAGVDAALLAAIDSALAFWRAMGGPEAEAAILRLNGARATVVDFGKTVAVTGKQIGDMLAQGGATAIDAFAQKVAETRDVIGSLRDAFLQFASDFLRQIAAMIAKQALLNAIGGGSGKGATDGVASVISALFRHDGGLVGEGGGFRRISPAVFANATRYHSGGIAGLRPNEVAAVLERGEEVLTADDPRHRDNLSGGGGRAVKVVNIFDTAEVFQRMVASDQGERVLMNFMTRNAAALKGAIG